MDLKKALKRIWKSWWYGFIAAIIIYLIVFSWAYNYEVQREEEREFGEDPIPLFQASISPSLSGGTGTYVVNVINNQKYTITSISIKFSGPNFVNIEDFQEVYTDEVSSGNEKRYTNNVLKSAESLDIVLEPRGTVIGFSNIDLYLENNDGSMTWSSTSTGNSEEIHLSQLDLNNYGYGNYDAIVKHEDGFMNVGFQLTYNINYGNLIHKHKSSESIGSGEDRNFEFVLNFDNNQLQELVCEIGATVELDEDFEVDIGMKYDSSWTIIEETRPIPEEVSESIPWGPVDLTGTSSAIMYTITVIAGFAFYIRSKLKKKIMPKIIRRVHCFISLTTLMLVFAHMTTAMQKDWPWESTGMRFAVIATILLVSFNIFSFFDVEIIKSIGNKKWRIIHLAFTIAMALSIVIHFGLMGDHLGWLK